MEESVDVERIRGQFPVVERRVFLNHAGVSPLSKPVFEAMRRYLEEMCGQGTGSADLGRCRGLFAGLIGARPGEVALVPNTSTGLNIVAGMLDYPPGSSVVVTDLEFPSVVYPWLRRRPGVEVRYVKNVDGRILLDDVEKAVDDGTVAVAISHVEYANGFRNDLGSLAEVAHRHGALLVVDAIQSAGAVRIDVGQDDVDFLTASCFKWLLGPQGAGFLYVRGDLVERFEPPMVGWASVRPEVFETADLWDVRSLSLSETATRFEVGTPSVVSFVGAAAALQQILDTGMEQIERRVLSLAGYLMEAVRERGFRLQTPEEPGCRSGIVNFHVDNPEKEVERLSEKGIVISARARGLRVSPHYYNTREEIDHLLTALTG